MAEDVKNEQADDLEGEKPSTIKAGAQRYLILAGFLITLLFIYLFITMSAAEKEKQAAKEVEEEVPSQVQSAGSTENQNTAITRFKRGITSNRNTSEVGGKVEGSGINDEFSPRKSASFESSQKLARERYQKEQKKQQQKNKQSKEKTPYQKFLEKEQARAYESISSADTLGDDSAFYGKSRTSTQTNSSVNKPNKQSIAERQADLQKKIKAISQYRKDIESGKLDVTNPPPELSKIIGGNQ